MSTTLTKDTGGSGLKVELIRDAYSKLRISGMTVDPTPADLEVALARLENMMAEWDSRNVSLGYNFQDSPDANDGHNLPRWTWDAVASCLAVKLIPDFNKTVPDTLKMDAQGGYSNISGRVAMDRMRSTTYPSRHPVGSGNLRGSAYWSRFYRESPAPNNPRTYDVVSGEIMDLVEHFDAFLDTQGGETISAFTITADPGITIASSSNTDTDVSYRVEAEDSTTSGSLSSQQVTIVVTTSAGRVEVRRLYFNITVVD